MRILDDLTRDWVISVLIGDTLRILSKYCLGDTVYTVLKILNLDELNLFSSNPQTEGQRQRFKS